MKKRGKTNFLSMILTLLILIAITHTLLHLGTYGTGISGLAIGKLSIFDKLEKSYTEMSTFSKVIIGVEWLLVITIAIVILSKGKMELKRDLTSLKETHNLRIKHRKQKPETDLDILYDLLKEKKILRMSAIIKLFKINKETAMDWFRIMEEGDLADIKYPTVGEPELSLNEQTNKE